jgi:adenosylcobinamide-phosphate synthase
VSFFALVTALLLEQFQPLVSRKRLSGWLPDYTDFFRHHLDAGEYKHGKFAWLLAVLPLLIAVMATSFLLHHIHPGFSFAFDVFVLYLSFGFRQFVFYFSDIRQELRADNLDEARELLSVWRGDPANELGAQHVTRLAIEEALLAAHHNVFGIIVWFVLFSAMGLGGAAGALLYRLAQFLRDAWTAKNEAEMVAFGRFAEQAFRALEWLPARITALIFAIVGNFEDTMYCWRTQAPSWPDKEEGIVLASGAGALGVCLGMEIPQQSAALDRIQLGLGSDTNTNSMKSTEGLLWRSLVVMLMVVLLASVARLLG